MTRLEENKRVVDEMIRQITDKPAGTYEEIMTFQIGAIAAMLTDISQSLAIIADDSERRKYE